MEKDKSALIREYLVKIKSASKEPTKREAFKDLLNRLYAGNSETAKVIDAITMGAERNVANIPRKNKVHRGSADTLYNKIIIEYENDFKGTLKHAKEQLSGYLLGQFNSGEGYNYTLIASDFINWKVFAPAILSIDNIKNLNEDELVLEEITSASFTLTTSNAENFYFWIDRFLFREEKQKATLKRIAEAFGHQSTVFIESYRELSNWFKEAKKFGDIQVSFEQWRKFLSIAYGKYDATESNFLIHTYLSVFSKMLAYSVVSNDDYIDEDELRGILDGDIFHKFNIRNFVDNDFFHWVKTDQNFKNLKTSFRLIAQEISAFDFTNVDEDVLKGVYQELIDLDTRHSLGEYYTPDWLCERVVKEFVFKKGDKILDPSCGSGSFLRAAVHRLKEVDETISIEEICNQVYGIDIHPLSVQIAKTTMLLALGKDISKVKRPIHINIILSNTLKIPEGVKTLFGSDFKMDIDKETFRLNSQVLEDMMLFDEGVDICDTLAEQTLHKAKIPIKTLENSLKTQYKRGGINQQIIESFFKIYEGLKSVKEKGRDSIWKFILQNLYKPYFLGGKFDYIIGNPPWFTYSSVKNEEYQNTLKSLAEKYNLTPDKVANFPHLEIAAIFLAHCTNYFLKESGKLAFVLPRSFFSADHHDKTRKGVTKGFKLTNIWDLKDVSPLFRIPSCVLFAERKNSDKKIASSGLEGLTISANLPIHNCNFETASSKLFEKPVLWFYVKQGKSTAFSTNDIKQKNKVNPYKKLFKQGATIVPRSFYFIELTQKITDFEDRIIHIKTADAIKPDAKSPWKETVDFNGLMESKFIFRTALSKSILPFTLYKPELIVLPAQIEINKYGNKEIKLYTNLELQRNGYLNASKWFFNVENIWSIYKTEKSKNMSSLDRINFQRGLSEQNLNIPYLVLYNSSAKDANATLVKRSDIDLEFIVESKAYFFATNDLKEAYYLTAILNSSTPNQLMKDFQSRGLFGARDVHKKILDIYYPKFNEKNKTHLQLAYMSESAHIKTSEFLSKNIPEQELSAIFLGRLRSDIKKYLQSEMKEIDELVKEVLL